MPPSDLETLAQSELRALENECAGPDCMFKKIVLSHVIAAKRREDATEKRFETLELKLTSTESKITRVCEDLSAFKSRIEFLELQRIAKLEARCEELERQIIRIVAYAAGISMGISVAAGVITFLATKP